MTTVLVPLTQGKFATIDEEDALAVLAFRWSATRWQGGRQWYATRQFRGEDGRPRSEGLHVFLLKPPAGMVVDHKDRDGFNCTRENLRIATRAQNSYNRAPNRRDLTGFKGVTVDPRRPGQWQANIHQRGKRYRLGSFPTVEDAARAYDRAARDLHGEFAYLNFSDD